MRIYNHDDALQYEERMKEYAEVTKRTVANTSFPKSRRRCLIAFATL
jgi:hypothetical protein